MIVLCSWFFAHSFGLCWWLTCILSLRSKYRIVSLLLAFFEFVTKIWREDQWCSFPYYYRYLSLVDSTMQYLWFGHIEVKQTSKSTVLTSLTTFLNNNQLIVTLNVKKKNQFCKLKKYFHNQEFVVIYTKHHLFLSKLKVVHGENPLSIYYLVVA